ncbi:MAG: hypothetical protein NTV73_05820 [Hyphomicrobiales bacterium]|nr:hypothetical protein [Hyphomicrobiales bacterium]
MATATTGKPGTKDISDLEADIKLLRADLETLVKQMQETGEHGYGAARRAAAFGAEALKAQGEAKLEELRASARDVEEQVLTSVREKPLTSLAIAAGVGFLFALIARR